MAKRNKKRKTWTGKQAQALAAKKEKTPKPGFIKNYLFHIAIFLLIVKILFGLFLFDPFIELMADDADYVMGAYNFITEGTFPTSHGTILYHLALVIPTLIFGPSILGIKILSFVWSIVTFILSYHVYKKITPALGIVLLLFFQATNFAVLNFSSSLLSESFFMMVQAFFILVVFKNIDSLERSIERSFRSFWNYFHKNYLIIVSVFLLSLSKLIALTAPVTVGVYLLFHKKWKQAIAFLGSFAGLKFGFDLVLSLLFSVNTNNRSSSVLLKNYYDRSEGKEDLVGLVERLFTNFDYHISYDFLRVLGLRDTPVGTLPATMPLFTALFFMIFVGLMVYVFIKNHKKLFFLGLYLLMLAGGTFIALQTHWKQDRMIIIMIPLILAFLLSSSLKWAESRNSNLIRNIILASFGCIFLIQIKNLGPAINENLPNLTKYMNGDRFAAYTPDWKNYLLAAQWANENLPKESVVACRKPNSSIVYTGDIKFKGYHRSTTDPGDQVLEKLKADGVTHILMANLRVNPNVAIPGRVIGTIPSYVRAIQSYDPSKIQILQQFGEEEQAYIIKINY